MTKSTAKNSSFLGFYALLLGL